jgi:UDP-GlcNAc:undecaprenyl-phosphate GlcNAc-1-phosphate transferase
VISALATWFLVSLALSFVGTRLLIRFVPALGVVDRPDGEKKKHRGPIPLLGGLAIFVAVLVCVAWLLANGHALTGGEIGARQYAGFLFGGLILMIGGYVDDRYVLPPRLSLVAPILAALVAVLFGIQIEKLTDPFGGYVYLAGWQSDALVFLWLLTVMYTTKLLDGVDGLTSSVSGVGVLMIMLLALSAAYFQPDVALLAAVCLGAVVGFLLWNLPPAAIFLGEGGSTFVGYMLGTLAVISGGKVATAALVLGFPILDVAWTVMRRASKGGLRQIFRGDRTHLHHRLIDLGWSAKQIVAAYVVAAALFGTAALFLQSREKLVAMMVLLLSMLLVALYVVMKEKRTYG